jgi:hypothetical protein
MDAEQQLEIIKCMVIDFVAAVVLERGQEKQDKAFRMLVKLASACLQDRAMDEAAEETDAIIAKLKEQA